MELTLDNKEALDILESGSAHGYEVIRNELIDSSRWNVYYELVIKQLSDGKYFKTTYSEGATEIQDERPFEYGEAKFTEVFPIKVVVTQYLEEFPKEVSWETVMNSWEDLSTQIIEAGYEYYKKAIAQKWYQLLELSLIDLNKDEAFEAIQLGYKWHRNEYV